MNSSQLLWLLPLLPLTGSLVLGSISLATASRPQGASERLIGVLAVLFPALAFLLTATLAAGLPLGESLRQTVSPWIVADHITVNFGFLFDDLSRIMLLFITGIGSLITLYSVGYMHGDRGFTRFMAYLNLFLFSMVTLVLSDNLVLTFLGWEGVGLCSYLLIGFWHKDPANVVAANKAFLVNRVGDLGFLLGIFALIALAGSAGISYPELRDWLRNPLNADFIVGQGHVLIIMATFFLFWGCTAKSAQIPLLTWLPDAMAGPTPVSALIHAATMVTSGIYLVARLSDLFVLSPLVMVLITLAGLGTAMWAAIAGLFQDDIKKVLAYSTVSQLGFMFLAVGCGAFDSAIFHVFTHAFFKAALFLGAGSVIHALAGNQDLRFMGGLAKKLPITFGILAAGWISIIGIPGTAGFWSKDLLLEKVYASGPIGPVLYFLALATAVLTAIYMTRMMVLTFAGSFRGDHHTLAHAHESPWTMQVPMIVLAVGSLLAGFLWAGLIPGLDLFERTLSSVVGVAQSAKHGAEHHGPSPWIFAIAGTAAAFVGALLGYLGYGRKAPSTLGAAGPQGFGKRWTLAFDSLHLIVIFPTKALAWISDLIIQPLFERTQIVLGYMASGTGDAIRKLQQPSLRIQLGMAIAGAVILTASILKEVL